MTRSFEARHGRGRHGRARRFVRAAYAALLFCVLVLAGRSARASEPVTSGRIPFEQYQRGTGFMGAFDLGAKVYREDVTSWNISPGGRTAGMNGARNAAAARGETALPFEAGWPAPALRGPDGSSLPVPEGQINRSPNGGHHIAARSVLGFGEAEPIPRTAKVRAFTVMWGEFDPHTGQLVNPDVLFVNPSSGVNRITATEPGEMGGYLPNKELDALVKILEKQGIPEGVTKVVVDDGRHPRRERTLKSPVTVPCECFVKGTPVATEDGPRAIDKVSAGDRVWAEDDEGKPVLRYVLHTFADPPRPIRMVTLARDGAREKLDTTDEHPFFVSGRGWTTAAELRPGDEVISRAGGPAKVVASDATTRREPTYNFEVEGVHNYYVGHFGVLVHNVCAVPRPPNRMARFMSFARAAAKMDVGGPGAVMGGVAAGFVGYALGGEYGALAAGFAYGTIAGKVLSQGAMSWSASAAMSGLGLAATLATDYALRKAGVENEWIRGAAGIGVGSLIPAAYAGWAAYAAPGGTLGAGGSAAAASFGVSCLWAVLAVEVTYHASQWMEIIDANIQAANGNKAYQDALNDIETWGFGSRYDPSTYIRYGVMDWSARLWGSVTGTRSWSDFFSRNAL